MGKVENRSILSMFKDDATGEWSLTRVSSGFVLVSNFVYAGWAVYKTGTMPDIGNNWLILVLALYGMNKTASAYKEVKIGGNTISS